MNETKTAVQICGQQNRDSCGYCDDGSSSSFGILSNEMNANMYDDLLNIGWRRCGTYYYKPTMHKTCCPQYTIRLEASKFQPTKSQKKTKRKVENVIKQMLITKNNNNNNNNTYTNTDSSASTNSKVDIDDKDTKYDNNNNSSVNDDTLAKKINNEMKIDNGIDKITSSSSSAAVHDSIRIITERASFTPEKFNLYKQYQVAVHHDEESDLSEEGFTNFLITSSLYDDRDKDKIPDASQELGTYHQCYYVKDQLVAVGVLDFLRSGLSSVYCFYDPRLPKLNLGKFTALKEIEYCVSHGFKYYYMGFYIHTCTKMKYKGEYSPSELLCPTTLTWHPLRACVPKLDTFKFCPLDEHMFEKFSQEYSAMMKDEVDYNNDSNNISNDDEKNKSIPEKQKSEEDAEKGQKKKTTMKELKEKEDKKKEKEKRIEDMLNKYAPQFFKDSQLPLEQAMRLSLMKVPFSLKGDEVLFFHLTDTSQTRIKPFIEDWISQVGQLSDKLLVSF